MRTVPVLIVGAGPVGLSMSLALARQGIASLTIERNPGLSEHPRARGVMTRTMEIFRLWGNDIDLLEYRLPPEALRFIWSESLQGKEITRVEMTRPADLSVSPTRGSLVSQDRVEQSLLKALGQYPEAEVEFATAFVSLRQEQSQVFVSLQRPDGTQETVCAQYLIGADGAHSNVRQHCEIKMLGVPNMGRFCSCYSSFDIKHLVQDRPAVGYFFTDPDVLGKNLLSVDGKMRWIVGLHFKPEDTPERFTDAYCLEQIRTVTGIPDLDVTLINKSFWTMAAQIASRYRQERVFLVGDAAHQLPPTGGFGMNTGIQDAHNLAWKLAFVLKNFLPESILDTYERERRPIAKQNMEWSVKNALRFREIWDAVHKKDTERLAFMLKEQEKHVNAQGLDLGYIYGMPDADQSLSISGTHDTYVPTTRPGARAPHVDFLDGRSLRSTLDLFEKEFVLIVASQGEHWQKALDAMTEKPFPVKSYRLLIEDLYEIPQDGAVLVRPDGHVAWRSQTGSDFNQLKSFLEQIAAGDSIF